jgi:hypothetical protein
VNLSQRRGAAAPYFYDGDRGRHADALMAAATIREGAQARALGCEAEHTARPVPAGRDGSLLGVIEQQHPATGSPHGQSRAPAAAVLAWRRGALASASIEANGKREPRVLFASRVPCSRHRPERGRRASASIAYENAVVQVVSGKLRLRVGDRRRVRRGLARHLRAAGDAQRAGTRRRGILILLAPWPGDGHFADGEEADPERMPVNAVVPPLD